MSADNWAVCPRCKKAKYIELTTAETALETAYGTVPLVEFDALRANVQSLRTAFESLDDETDEANFREDYEIYGAETGVLHFVYRGTCTACDLTYRMEHEWPFYPPVPETS